MKAKGPNIARFTQEKDPTKMIFKAAQRLNGRWYVMSLYSRIVLERRRPDKENWKSDGLFTLEEISEKRSFDVNINGQQIKSHTFPKIANLITEIQTQ